MPAQETFISDGETPLIQFLFAQLPGFKRTKLRNLVRFQAVTVNGKTVIRGDHLLQPGDKVQVLVGGKPEKAPALRRDIEIVYEDAALLVVNKPAGLLTVATATEKKKTLFQELNRYLQPTNPTGEQWVYLVHRLDRETSGLVIFAKTAPIRRALKENWRQVEKKYLAIVEGTPTPPTGRIASYLREDASLMVRSGPQSGEAKHAVTHYTVLASNRNYALLEIRLETGRKNQIRVHCADMRHPVVGDEKYGAKTNPAGRLALHSYALAFDHPASKKPLAFTCPLPKALQGLVPWRSP